MMAVLKFKNKTLLSLFTAVLILCISVLNPMFVKGKELEDEYSGEELFAGIVFGQGEVGELFPEVWSSFDYETLNSDEALNQVEQIIVEIQEKDSTFFDDLKKVIDNKNIFELDKIMERVAPLLMESVEDINKNGTLDEAIGRCVVVVFVAVGVGAVGVQHQWVVNHESFWTTSAKSIDANKLEKEKFVASIMDRL